MQAALNVSVFARVTTAIEQTTYTGSQNIMLETRLISDLAIGKFGRTKLAMYLEELFDIELPDEVLERFVAVTDIVRYIERHYFRDVEPFQLIEAA